MPCDFKLPKPTKDWLKGRPIISFFRTGAAPLLTVFGALIFELTKITFPDIPGQLSVQDLVHQRWEALSSADPTEYIQLASQDLSGFFTSIPTERFHFKFSFIVMIKWWDCAMYHTGLSMR